MKPFIGIKRIWYGDPLNEAPTGAGMSDLVKSMTEVTNSHEGTWSYTQDDPSITDYINELTGKPYYRDATNAGNKTISFTMGVYSFTDRVALQGGEVSEETVQTSKKISSWSSASSPELVYKCIVAQTKTGNFIVFTNAGVIAKTNAAEKNLGLGVTAVAMDNETTGVSDEYLFDGENITLSES